MSLSPKFMDELRSRVTLSELIGKHVRLVRAGREYKGCCPFHNEKTPSFYVNDDKQFYHCFGCGAHGDAISFLTEYSNLPFMDAVESLAAQAGLSVPKPDPKMAARQKEEKGVREVLETAQRYYHEQLLSPKNQDVLKYLTDRGLKKDTIKAFQIGYAPENDEDLKALFKGEGIEQKLALQSGLFKESNKGWGDYAFFKDRVMFPVCDRRGRVVAFGGRILPDHLRPPDRGDYKPPKYLNSAESELFQKGHMLYAEHVARRAAADGQDLLVVEGYMDVVACHQAGFKGALAPNGTALTEAQIALLWKMIPEGRKEPILCFDGDTAGITAAARALHRTLPMLQPNHSLRFAFMPPGEDPDSLIKSGGAAALRGVLNNAKSLADVLWDLHTEGKQFSTPEQKAGLKADLEREIAVIQDSEVQYHYRTLFKNRMFEFFRTPFKPGVGARPGGRPSSSNAPRRPSPTRDMAARILLAALIRRPDIFHDVEEELGQLECRQAGLEKLRNACIQIMSVHEGLDMAALTGHLNENALGEDLKMIMAESVLIHTGFADNTHGCDEVAQAWKGYWHMWAGSGDSARRAEARNILLNDPDEDAQARAYALLNDGLEREQHHHN